MGHLGLLKAKLAKLRRELITPKGGGGGTGEGFDVAKTGDARVGFVGMLSVLSFCAVIDEPPCSIARLNNPRWFHNTHCLSTVICDFCKVLMSGSEESHLDNNLYGHKD